MKVGAPENSSVNVLSCITQVTTEHEDLTRVEIYFDNKKEIIPSYPSR